MGLTFGHFGKLIGNTLKVMKRTAEEIRRSFGPIVRKVTMYYTELKVNGTSYIQ
jgi:hypothetical protein